MKTENFTKLIRAITGRNFTIEERVSWRTSKAAGETIDHEKSYYVGITLPRTGRSFGFDWKTPKSDEKMLRSFITAFTSKYREPDPRAYVAGPNGGRNWDDMSDADRERAYSHHSSKMLSKDKLMAQIEAGFSSPEIETALNQWGFYETEYGIGIFCFWQTRFVRNAIDRMRAHLSGLNIATKEEFSDAGWVYRFRIEASKDMHRGILGKFTVA
jgi:hypothetical protein